MSQYFEWLSSKEKILDEKYVAELIAAMEEYLTLEDILQTLLDGNMKQSKITLAFKAVRLLRSNLLTR